MQVNRVDGDRGLHGSQPIAVRNDDKSSSAVSVSRSESIVRHEAGSLLSELRNQLRQLPDVRSDRVAEVSAKLAAGYFDSAESVEHAALAVMKALSAS